MRFPHFVGGNLSIFGRAGQYRHVDPHRARRMERLGRGRERRARGHDVIDEQHGPSLQPVCPPRHEGLIELAEPLLPRLAAQGRGPHPADQEIGDHGMAREPSHGIRQKRRLIVAAAQQARPVEGDRHDHRLRRKERRRRPGHPARKGAREVGPVAMLQREDELATKLSVYTFRYNRDMIYSSLEDYFSLSWLSSQAFEFKLHDSVASVDVSVSESIPLTSFTKTGNTTFEVASLFDLGGLLAETIEITATVSGVGTATLEDVPLYKVLLDGIGTYPQLRVYDSGSHQSLVLDSQFGSVAVRF